MIKSVFLAVFILWPMYSVAAVDMKIVTSSGFVAFTVESYWPVISMQSKLPIAAAAFQIPNQADEGTTDSTNLVIKFYDPTSPEALQSLQKVGQVFGSTKPKEELFKEWVLYRQKSVQGSTEYSIADAKRSFKNIVVSVRLAWPHLKSNPITYDAQMEDTLHKVLLSIKEHVGAWEPKSGEVIRRPEK